MMLENIAKKLDSAFNKVRGKGLVTEKDIDAALKDVRLALLESDVHYGVVKSFCGSIREKALGKSVLESLTPGQQVIKIVKDELTSLMGGEGRGLSLSSKPPTVILLAGLQGAGKTTTAGKIARFFLNKNRRVVLIAADLQRPAAVDQLTILGKGIGVPVVRPDSEKEAVEVVQRGIDYSIEHGSDVVIIDTAGRLEVDQALMEELSQMKARFEPHEILLVADAMTGQSAVHVAQSFHQKLGLTGIAEQPDIRPVGRGQRAVLSIRSVTGAPIRFLGTGEKLDALETFYPDRMASRILGMGDILSLVELAEENTSREEAAQLQKKFRKNEFTLEDFSSQLKQLKKMGGAAKIMDMIPGMNRLKLQPDQGKVEKGMKSVEAIISSMTINERKDPSVINGSRRKRISRGSGTSVQEVNRLLKQYYQAKKMMKRMSSGKRGGMGGIPLPF
ncbi:MAG: signal recognition particle protein [Nitrospiria bacterium]